MKIYIGGHGAIGGKGSQVNKVRFNERLGFMFTPFDWIRHYDGNFALDNGAFSSYINGTPFDDESFLKIVDRIGSKADFIILPDRVAEGKRSLEYSEIWRKFLPDDCRYYLAVQNGMKAEMLKSQFLELIDGIFIGGTMEWKLRYGSYWSDFAHSTGLKCHAGRIGTLNGLMWADKNGLDSVDSSTLLNRNAHRRILGKL